MTVTVFGKPVEGNINFNSRIPVEQRDSALLQDAYERLFDYPQLKSVSWTQYTPYFNDGDECIFSVHGLQTAVLNGAEPGPEYDEYDDGESFVEPEYSLVQYDYTHSPWSKTNLRLSDKFPQVKALFETDEDGREFAKALVYFADELGSGGHDVFLKKTFGDHAVVTATADGFSVDYYEHY